MAGDLVHLHLLSDAENWHAVVIITGKLLNLILNRMFFFFSFLSAIFSGDLIVQNIYPFRGCSLLVLINQLSRLKQCGKVFFSGTKHTDIRKIELTISASRKPLLKLSANLPCSVFFSSLNHMVILPLPR